MSYTSTKITLPPGSPPEVVDIVTQMQRELDRISDEFKSFKQLQLQQQSTALNKPRKGMVSYADGISWNPGEGEGLYVFTDTWKKLQTDKSRIRKISTSSNNTYTSTTASIPTDDTIPQISEGTELITCSITPTSATSKLLIMFESIFYVASTDILVYALFKNLEANAVSACTTYVNALHRVKGSITKDIVAGTTSELTFSIRYGVSAGTAYVNGGTASRLFGGVMEATMVIMEYEPL